VLARGRLKDHSVIKNDSLATRYLTLLKKSLLNVLYLENEARIVYLVGHLLGGTFPPVKQAIADFLDIKNSDIFRAIDGWRTVGGHLVYGGLNNLGQPDEVAARNFLYCAHTMIGAARLDNLHTCLDTIVRDNIPGDLIETGVWRGGATIFMRGFLAARAINDRVVWVADSFDGLPAPLHEKDSGWDLSKGVLPYLCVSLEDVKDLFQRYELLDEKVRFLKGWFRDTLPDAPISRLALLRLDGDLYESTMDALNSLYPRLSDGGFVIVDDYDALPQCREAIHDFRSRYAIEDPLIPIDAVSVYWRKESRKFSNVAARPSLIFALLKRFLN